MHILLSPAKIQQFSEQPLCNQYSVPAFLKEAEELVALMRELLPSELSKLLQINRGLTQLNIDRYLMWQLPFSLSNARQAAFVFDGEVFRGLQAASFSDDDLQYAQHHLRILSGLYGVLRPLDLIQPYRLEVSSRLENPEGKDLYPYWKNKVTHLLREELLTGSQPPVVLNLASTEYFKMTNLKTPDIQLIDVEFYEYSNDSFRQVVIYTKKARGWMARYVITKKISSVDDLKGFDMGGYWYDPHQSTDTKLVFVR